MNQRSFSNSLSRMPLPLLFIMLMLSNGCASGLSLLALNKAEVELCCNEAANPTGTVRVVNVGRSITRSLLAPDLAPPPQWRVVFDSDRISISPLSGTGEEEIQITALQCGSDAEITVIVENLNGANSSELTVFVRQDCTQVGGGEGEGEGA